MKPGRPYENCRPESGESRMKDLKSVDTTNAVDGIQELLGPESVGESGQRS